MSFLHFFLGKVGKNPKSPPKPGSTIHYSELFVVVRSRPEISRVVWSRLPRLPLVVRSFWESESSGGVRCRSESSGVVSSRP